jgi:hypothetical protein
MEAVNDGEVPSDWIDEEKEPLVDDICDMEDESLNAADIDPPDVLHSSPMDAMVEDARFLHSTE